MYQKVSKLWILLLGRIFKNDVSLFTVSDAKYWYSYCLLYLECF